MATLVSLTEVQILTALRALLLSVLDPGIEVLRSQLNRVPEPRGADFVMMTPILHERLETNQTTLIDAVFTGLIVGNVLTLSNLVGHVGVGSLIFGVGVLTNTQVIDVVSSTVYHLSLAQTVASSKLAAGQIMLRQATQVTIQLDIHGPNSSEVLQIITTVFRDIYGCDAFTASGVDVQPLYTNPPHQTPFVNGEKQIEMRWTVDLVLQANPVITLPQQFADKVVVTLNENS